jgi:2-polyprenyl-6-methoxyphenol hydroxylase-like FAD-dependent oxidoreductase
MRVSNRNVDVRIRDYVHKISKQRAPWFTAEVKEITWCTQVHFERRMAQQFGRGRGWVLGDAAHQTGPVGVQSMNAGFAEAEALAPLIRRIIEEHAPLSTLQSYDQDQQKRWRRLLGLTGGLKSNQDTDPWLSERANALLPCLPGLDGDLTQLAGQLGMEI